MHLYGGVVGSPLREALDLVGDPETTLSVQRMVLERMYRGTGGLLEWYPETIASWRARHRDDSSLTKFAGEFCRSAACALWREHSTTHLGISLEEALYRFFEMHEVGQAATREDELAGAVVRALAVSPRSAFAWPAVVRATPTGCCVVTRSHMLHASVNGAYLHGPVTSLVACLLVGSTLANEVGHSAEDVRVVRAEMVRRGLLAAGP